MTYLNFQRGFISRPDQADLATYIDFLSYPNSSLFVNLPSFQESKRLPHQYDLRAQKQKKILMFYKTCTNLWHKFRVYRCLKCLKLSSNKSYLIYQFLKRQHQFKNLIEIFIFKVKIKKSKDKQIQRFQQILMHYVQQQGSSLKNQFQLQQQIIHTNQIQTKTQITISNGQIYPLIQLPCCTIYNSPQFGMLTFTFLLTISLEIIMLKFVYFGIHFYIGIVLCAYILYLLLYLGFSDPGLASKEYEKMSYHFKNQVCISKCKHSSTLAQEFNRFCYKCNVCVTKTTRHCNTCNVCVTDYDHHCVFIGKCVGANNLNEFHRFLCMIFSTLIYGLVSALLTIKEGGVIAILQKK